MDSEDSCPISLYLSLEPGKFASLEAVAKSALSYSAAIREAAYILDPSLEIRIEIERGEEGSLSIETIIKKIRQIKQATESDPTDLRTIAIVFALWLTGQGFQYGYTTIADMLFKSDEKTSISDEDANKIAEKVVLLLNNKQGQDHVREIFVELEHDPSITGVGVTLSHGEKPKVIVPRSEFASRAGASKEGISHEKREIRQTRTATLISPVLVDKDRKWRFKFKEGEFAVRLEDKQFLRRVLSGRSDIVLREGIELIVRMRFDEEKENGVWVTKDRTIEKVVKYPKIQNELRLLSRMVPKKDK